MDLTCTYHAGGANLPQPVPPFPPMPMPPARPMPEMPAPEIVEPPLPGHFPLLGMPALLLN